VLKEKFKNIAALYFPELSASMIYEKIARILINGKISASCYPRCSRKEVKLISLHVYTGFGRKFKQKRGMKYSI
jgi:hypothetical protein